MEKECEHKETDLLLDGVKVTCLRCGAELPDLEKPLFE